MLSLFISSTETPFTFACCIKENISINILEQSIIISCGISPYINTSWWNAAAFTVKGLVKDIANYKSIFNPDLEVDTNTYKINNYFNKNVNEVKKDLENKFKEVIIIGNGDKIINQYPNAGTILSTNEKVHK